MDHINKFYSYIFCENFEKHATWASSFVKIGEQRIIKQTQDLFDRITNDIRHVLDAKVSINIFNQGNGQSTQDLDEEGASAMWFQLMIDVLIKMEEKYDTKNEMAFLCDLLNVNNMKIREQIADFTKNYQPENAVSWYTGDKFLYRLLNKALRLKHINVIYPFRFFIADLHRQLCQLHKEFIDLICTDKLTVYRGQKLHIGEIRKLEKNKNGLISFNTFLSTTTNRGLALSFAGNEKDESVLFIIEIDILLNTKIPFGSIAYVSRFSEDEVLFSIGAIFRISNVKQIENIYQITLKISDQENEEMKRLFAFYYKHYKINEPTSLITLGLCLHQMGQYDQAAHYYRLMLYSSDILSNYDMQAKLYTQLGYVAKTQGDYRQAITEYNQALDLILKHNPTNHEDLFDIYNNLGVAHRYLSEFDHALKFAYEAFDAQAKFAESSDVSLSTVYNTFGHVYLSKKDYLKAEEHFQKALNVFINSSTIPYNHPNRATLLSNIAHLYRDMGRNDEAIIKLNEILTFQLKVLPENHIHIGRTYNNLACVYLSKNQHYKTALRCLKRTLSIYLENLPLNHPWIALVYMNIAWTYYGRKMYLIGWLYARKAMGRINDFPEADPNRKRCTEVFDSVQGQLSYILSTLIIGFNGIEALSETDFMDLY
ncbi:unnamed protein product [Adineta steineri]|uniref:NAD(P)(+)--arginine ADP-ribosyltransferase n=1 Tax=Adineta steineri TaxID=433720 RepID=A0A815RF18_9BILA|nr:unnamed protein product [Adineta steineri]CAF1637346.1 unnamed protein product [Adineta steineri]